MALPIYATSPSTPSGAVSVSGLRYRTPSTSWSTPWKRFAECSDRSARCSDERSGPGDAGSLQLAEGPVWDVARQRLLWVDILAGSVLEGTLRDGQIEVTLRHHFDGMVGAVTVADDGAILVAAQEHLVVLDPDGNRHDGVRIVPAGQRRRLNDGSTDPAGRFLVGTLSLGDPSEREILVRLEPDGHLTVLDNDLTLSNGLAWSTDGIKMYSVDTNRQTIYVRDYDPTSGAVGERRPHLRLGLGPPMASPWMSRTTSGWRSGARARSVDSHPTEP